MSGLENLPVPIKENPYWRVVVRPFSHEPTRVANIGDLLEIVNRNQVRLRGWYFPHIGNPENQLTGKNWIGSWSNFAGHSEYWRFYQSTQFIYLSSVREKTEKSWDEKLRAEFYPRLAHRSEEQIRQIPGFISIINTIYTITEFFEFASRLCQAGIYAEPVEVRIELHGIRNFALTTSLERLWYELYQATENELEWSSKFEPSDLIALSGEKSLDVVVWFFQRFGWLNVRPENLKDDQEKFVTGQR